MNKKVYASIFVFLIIGICILIAMIPKINYRYHQHLEASNKTQCNHKESKFCTHLPIISISTGNKEIPGATKEDNKSINGVLTVFNNSEKNNHTDDSPSLTTNINLKYRGASSRHYDKKGILVKTIDKNNEKKDISLLGMDSHSEWVLHGPYLDKTLMRNYMWYNISGEIMEYAPNVRYCEVFINGEYNGVYVLVEKIEAGEDSRIKVRGKQGESNETGYILRLDRGVDNPIENVETFTNYSLRFPRVIGKTGYFNIVYPGASDLTPEINKYIQDDFGSFEKSLYSYDYDSRTYGYSNYIDVNNFVDYMIINEFTCNYDALRFSTYIYKDIGGKYKFVVWDFNSACDYYETSVMNPLDFEFQDGVWYFMLLKDEKFTEKVISRYKYLRKNVLSEEYLLSYIDDVSKYLGDAVKRNYDKWGYSFGENYDYLTPKERNVRNFDEAIKQMKDFIIKRGDWLDKNIETLRQYSHESKVKKFNH